MVRVERKIESSEFTFCHVHHNIYQYQRNINILILILNMCGLDFVRRAIAHFTHM